MRKPLNYWNKERCNEVALKCKTKTEFRINYGGAYKKARKNGWLDEICSHIIPQGNLFKRLVYVYEFSDNYTYIGITCN